MYRWEENINMYLRYPDPDDDHVVQSLGLRLLAGWHCGFESWGGH